MSLRLIIEDYEGDRMVVPLPEDEGPVTLGRAADNHVRLPERNVSRRHAELHPGEDGWLLVDADSYNGILVNGEVVDGDRPLEVGDFIVLADYQLLVGSDARALEEDVAALARATEQRKQAMLEAQDSPDVADILPSTFPAPSTPLVGIPGASHTSPLYDDTVDTGSKGRHMLWILGAVAAMCVAAVLTLNLGEPGPQQASNRAPTGQGAMAAAPANKAAVAKASPAAPAPVEKPDPKPEDPPDTPTAPTPAQDSPASATPSPAAPPKKPEPKAQDTQPKPQPTVPTAPASPAAKKPRPQPQTPRPKREKDPARAKEQAKLLMKRARKAAMGGRHQEAMSLARRSFRAQATQESLQVLGLAACKVPHRGMAEFAFNRLRRGESRRILVKVCGDAGITLN